MSSKSKPWQIRFTVFASGAIVMSVEMMASRLFAPSFGDSVFVWGSLIGVIMLALALGYWQGGKRADRNPHYSTLSHIVMLAGFFVILIPSASPFVLEFIQLIGLGDTYGPLLASAILLTIPTMLLGMVSPYAVRLSTESIIKLGSISGSLSTINTIGSILGTFFTVFVLIPNFGTREILLSLGVLLVGISLVGRDWRDWLIVVFLVTILILPDVVMGGKLHVLGGTTVYKTESPYSTLTVVDKESEGIRTLYLNNMPHSAMYLNGSESSVYEYTDYFNLGFGYNRDIKKVLFIGGGGFSSPKHFLERYPWVSMDVVEIDPDVIEIAYDYFRVPKDEPRLDVYSMDGRAFLEEAGTYDLIVLDAYSDTYVPFHLMTIEFHQELIEHLNPGGVITSNLISSLVGDTSELLWCEVETVSRFYPQVDLYTTRYSSAGLVQNIVMVATTNPISLEKIEENIAKVIENPEPVQGYLETRYEGESSENSFVLRDNYAPVESLLNPVTLTSYEREGRLRQTSLFNPYILTGIWIISLGSVYLLIQRWSKQS
ncbi:hypothetical protein GF319_05765 [Candidatus Bathyarchaeota archaeon]|nr:hypothetical protein [Candidatus Bathyarchaeota archaeon]